MNEKCQDCKRDDVEVRETHCPYESDIHSNVVPITVCEACYDERAENI